MTDVEALMWNLEKDPFLSASIANLTILDQPPDRARLRDRIARATTVVARLRQRVVPAFGRLAPPEWQDDPDFDLDYHLRWVGLPPAGTERDLYDLASTIVHDPFDRTRPLWEFVVIEGLEDGRAAMVQKLHHTITDGEGGVRLSEQFIDLTRDATEPIAGARSSAGADHAGDAPGATGLASGTDEDGGAPHPRSVLETVGETATHNVRRLVGIARRGAAGAADLVAHPAEVPRLAAELGEVGQSLARQLVVADGARSPLWTARSLRRRLETLRVPLEPARQAAHSLGGSINDLFVAAAAGAAGAYHQTRGAEVDDLRISMPVSTRRDRSAGGNAFTPTRVLVPVDISDPEKRFVEVRDRLAGTRGERSIDLAEGFAGIVNLLPTSLLVQVARRQVATVDFATSNVRGAPFDLYLAGAKLVANYPIGPTGGTAFNLTLLSSAGSLDMGLNIDTAAVGEPAVLRDGLVQAFEELLAAGGTSAVG